MNKKIIRSTITLAVVLVLGAGVTYAQLTSNEVIIGTSAMTSGESALKLCNDTGDDKWKLTIMPNLSLADMVPGATKRELTKDSLIYVGNDDGDLTNNLGGVSCNAYGPGEPLGSSDVPMQLVPTVTIDGAGCELQDDMRLTFTIGEIDSTEKTLAAWAANTTKYGKVLLPDEVAVVQMWGRLDSDVTKQNSACAFTVKFVGQQVNALAPT